MVREILVGADPEVFMKRTERKTFTSAHGVIPGTKENPHRVKNGAVQVDGMALEFNIDPAKNRKEFIHNLNSVMGQLGGMVEGYDLHAVPTARFMRKHIAAQPKEALELGCEPDYNAWDDGKANPRPDAKDLNFRTGAGHVHIGWGEGYDVNDPNHIEACIMATKQLDYYLGLGSLLYDTDDKRRQLYGKAGAFRPKPYGVEYRVLSNAWLQSDELMGWVYEQANRAIRALLNGRRAYENWGSKPQRLIDDTTSRDGFWIKHLMDEIRVPAPPMGVG